MELKKGEEYSYSELEGHFDRVPIDVNVNGKRRAAFLKRGTVPNESNLEPDKHYIMNPSGGNNMVFERTILSREYYKNRIEEPP